MRGRLLILLLLSLAGSACQQAKTSLQPPPNVLLVVLDTLRAGVVSGYGAPKSQTPTVARLAREGVLFTNARSTSAWTVPAHASMFTGRYPSRHGAHGGSEALALEAVTLAELLSATHETVGFSENPHIRQDKQFDQGFDRFRNTWPRFGQRQDRRLPTDLLAVKWLRRRSADRPFFLFLNFMDPHLPYHPPAEYLSRFVDNETDPIRVQELMAIGDEEARLWIAGRLGLSPQDLAILRQLYAAEAAYVDARLGKVIRALKVRGWLDQTLVIVVGDHGENIGDHGLMEHQFCLYESLLRVPLIMRWPGRIAAHLRRGDPVQLVDVFPTILEAAGVDRDRWPSQEGSSLLAGPVEADRPVVAEYMLPHSQQRIFAKQLPDFDFTPLMRQLRSIQIGSEKLILSGEKQFELYDLSRDPNEEVDLATERPERVRFLAQRLQQWLDEGPRPFVSDAAELSLETAEDLRELGYLE